MQRKQARRIASHIAAQRSDKRTHARTHALDAAGIFRYELPSDAGCFLPHDPYPTQLHYPISSPTPDLLCPALAPTPTPTPTATPPRTAPPGPDLAARHRAQPAPSTQQPRPTAPRSASSRKHLLLLLLAPAPPCTCSCTLASCTLHYLGLHAPDPRPGFEFGSARPPASWVTSRRARGLSSHLTGVRVCVCRLDDC